MKEWEIVQHPQIQGLTMFFNTVEHRTTHLHAEYELLWVLEGELVVTGPELQAQAGPGGLLLLNPQQAHEFRSAQTGGCTFFCVQVSAGLFHAGPVAMGRVAFSPPFPICFRERGGELRFRQYLAQGMEAYLKQEPGYELRAVGMMHLAFYQLLQEIPWRQQSEGEFSDRRRRGDRLQRLISFVEENYAHKIRLSDFAAAEGRTLSYLSHFVKENLNQNFQAYVNLVRFRHACELMHQEGSMRLLDICETVGFSDYRYFSQTFQKRLGMTPENYRRLIRQQAQDTPARTNPHSVERFYSREASLELLEKYLNSYL